MGAACCACDKEEDGGVGCEDIGRGTRSAGTDAKSQTNKKSNQ